MEKKTTLLNIYLKIHQKRDLSWEDLEYLARFDPECFEKTCENVVYNIPKSKPVIFQKETQKEKSVSSKKMEVQKEEKRPSVDQLLKNLKNMELEEYPVGDFDVERVKNLLGNLYMEHFFPHTDAESFFNVMAEERGSVFDKKA